MVLNLDSITESIENDNLLKDLIFDHPSDSKIVKVLNLERNFQKVLYLRYVFCRPESSKFLDQQHLLIFLSVCQTSVCQVILNLAG